MKKFLLPALLLTAICGSAATLYTPPTQMYGECQGISDNGQFAVWSDSDENSSYMWFAEDPDNPDFLEHHYLYDISDDGTFVGYRVEGGVHYPGFFKDGEWTDLPRTPQTLNTSAATCITPDAKYIGGFLYCKPSTPGGVKGYIPARWEWDETEGEYTLTLFDNIDYGDQQGMYITCISPDGQILAGSFFYGFSAQIDAIIKDNELKYWEQLEEREVVWYYKGQPYGTETGYFINGYRDNDTSRTFNDAFYFCDNEGNLYCNRTRVLEITDPEEGTGTIRSEAAVYNYISDEWFWNENYTGWSCGLNRKYEFPYEDKIVVDGEELVLSTFLDVNMEGLEISHISRLSGDGKVLGGATKYFSPIIGEYEFEPFMIVLDEPLIDNVSAPSIYVGKNKAIVVNGKTVDFCGSEGMVYDMSGQQAGAGKKVTLDAGIYVARIGKDACKIMIK